VIGPVNRIEAAQRGAGQLATLGGRDRMFKHSGAARHMRNGSPGKPFLVVSQVMAGDRAMPDEGR